MVPKRLGLAIMAAMLVGACSTNSTTAPPATATAPQATPGAGGASAAPSAAAATDSGAQVTLTIESWRSDDKELWNTTIIPAFEKDHPNIKLDFAPVLSTEYDNTLATRLQGGQAGDIITCRPFDVSQNLYTKGYLKSLNDLPGIQDNYPASVKTAWSTDDGATIFCVPVASVIHGFFYNKDVFSRLNLKVPTTNAEFMSVLTAIKDEGKVAPLALGVKDQWPVALNGYYNIGPNYWKGEQGRYGLIMATQKFTDPQFVEPFKQLQTWIPFLGNDYQAVGYSDAQTLFELGRAGINPGGSWDLAPFEKALGSKLGWFAPPVPNTGDKCYQEDHIDLAIGMNADSKNPAAAKTFLEWVASSDFETLYANSIPGFFPVTSQAIELKDPIAQEVLNTRTACEGSLRLSYQFLSRGEPNLENDLWTQSAAVISNTSTPDDATKLIQDHLSSWYKAPAGFTPPATP